MSEEEIGLDLEVDRGRSAVRVRLRGELDPHTAPGLQEVLNDALEDPDLLTVELELSGLNFIDSAGLRVVLSTQRALEDRAGRLVLQSPSRTVARLLEITGLIDHLEVE